MQERARVSIIDDEQMILNLLKKNLEGDGNYCCEVYSSAEQFLSSYGRHQTECVVTDLRLPQITGVELQARLRDIDPSLSIVFVSGHVDVPTAVRIMQQGAITVLQKPISSSAVLDAVKKAVERTYLARQEEEVRNSAESRFSALDDEEMAVLECLRIGMPHKAIASKLGLSSRTVDRRRQSIMKKTGAASLAELISMQEKYGHRAI